MLLFELQLHVNEFCVSRVFDHILLVLMTTILATGFWSSDHINVITIHTKYIRLIQLISVAAAAERSCNHKTQLKKIV